ncbi:esterase/lipase family protein [Aliarcobacter lanthieri]|uniref:esterase/lipase family protein n=1 Tax=Aliarcobacter lanthieri TaxID=1355374 RepID=UPI003AFA8C7A
MSLKILHKGEDNSELLIFIHGLGGDINTFKNGEGKFFHNYFEESILNKVDVAYFEYPSKVFSSKRLSVLSNIGFIGKFIPHKFNLDINTITELLKTEYNNCKKKYQRINFIGHSLGGIIAKNFLVNHIEDFDKKILYITLSTPHRGSIFAEKYNLLNNPHMKELVKSSSILIELDEGFKYKKDKFFRKYYIAIHDTIVKSEDAFQKDDKVNVINVHGNHIMISKPSNDHDSKTLIESINNDLKEFLNIENIKVQKKELNIRDVLFEGYKKEFKPYYLERDIDRTINKILNVNSIWIYGDSGVGKTNVSQYYMQNNKAFFHSTYFTSRESNYETYLKIIFDELVDRVYVKSEISEHQHINQKLKAIICELTSKYESVTLHLDELSDLEKENIQKFLISLIDILSNNISGCCLNNFNIIITTRFNPEAYLEFQEDFYSKKLSTLFQFIKIDKWEHNELKCLFDLLSKELNLDLEYSEIEEGIECPRGVKEIIRKKLMER